MLPDVEVGIQLSEYVISEGGSGVQVCAELVFGVLERNVSVELTTSPGTANGENLKAISPIKYNTEVIGVNARY